MQQKSGGSVKTFSFPNPPPDEIPVLVLFFVPVSAADDPIVTCLPIVGGRGVTGGGSGVLIGSRLSGFGFDLSGITIASGFVVTRRSGSGRLGSGATASVGRLPIAVMPVDFGPTDPLNVIVITFGAACCADNHDRGMKITIATTSTCTPIDIVRILFE